MPGKLTSDRFGRTLRHYKVNTVQILLENGADPNLMDNNKSALHRVPQEHHNKNALHGAIYISRKAADTDIVMQILKQKTSMGYIA